MKKVKRIIEYFKDVKWWILHYPKDWHKQKSKGIALRNALYCVVPARWKIYNKILCSKLVYKFIGVK